MEEEEKEEEREEGNKKYILIYLGTVPGHAISNSILHTASSSISAII